MVVVKSSVEADFGIYMKILSSKIGLFGLVLTGFAIVHALSLFTLLKLPFFDLLIDSLVFTLLCFFVSLMMQNILQFSKQQLLPVYLRIFNFTILALFSLGITLGLMYAIEMLIFDDSIELYFYDLIALRSMLFVMIYLIHARLESKQCDENGIHEDTPENGLQTAEPDNNINNHTTIERFAIKSGAKIHVVPVAEIIYLLADGDYVQVVTEKGKFLKEQTMKYFETHLPENEFIRVHRSHIVNVAFISRIELHEKQNQQLTLKNGHKIKVSQQGYKMLRQKLKL